MLGEFFILKNKIKNLINSEFKNKSNKILDLGCGNNPYYHVNISGKIICLDIKKTSKTHLISNADKLPFKPDSFDKVISVNSFYYFKNPFNVVKSINNMVGIIRFAKIVLTLIVLIVQKIFQNAKFVK